jgi:hypothetical protein
MPNYQDRLNKLIEALRNWFVPDNQGLREAIRKTVDEGYFAEHDVRHAIRALKQALLPDELNDWLQRSLPDPTADIVEPKSVLCLHAGNIPMVGFQDVLVTLMSGHRYVGKVSKKDPYLLPCLLDYLNESGFDISYALTLEEIPTQTFDRVLFSGSEESVPKVKQALRTEELVTSSTQYLIRTAHFSIAYLDSLHPEHMKALTEAIFRYGGQGCRSVGIVVSPYPLDEIKCGLTDYIESFWLNNPQHLKPEPKLAYRFAYNKAIERSQAWLDDFLLQEGGFELDQSFITYWTQGEWDELVSLADYFGPMVQQLYLPTPDYDLGRWNHRVDMLSQAQSPHLDWQPDGVDPLQWLLAD